MSFLGDCHESTTHEEGYWKTYARQEISQWGYSKTSWKSSVNGWIEKNKIKISPLLVKSGRGFRRAVKLSLSFSVSLTYARHVRIVSTGQSTVRTCGDNDNKIEGGNVQEPPNRFRVSRCKDIESRISTRLNPEILVAS